MLVAAAVCPCPPLLVPEVAAGAAPEMDAARAACAEALGVLAAARPDRLVIVGPAGPADPTGPAGPAGVGSYPQGTRGTFRGFGVPLDVRLGQPPAPETADRPVPAPDVELPSSLAVAAWLLEHARWRGAPVEGYGVAEELPVEQCLRLGAGFVGGTERVALLVMGDASACRTLKAPGYLDERAAGFDAGVARALGAADLAALRNLDASLARELQAAGRAPWQVLAGAADGAGLDGTLLHDEAPYGVGYLVAAWS
ncbi:class III extradiol dioxygenase subunit B-like domain-containing protein [Streptomyces sp. NPDC002851]